MNDGHFVLRLQLVGQMCTYVLLSLVAEVIRMTVLYCSIKVAVVRLT